jgi:hypothetical protein
MHVDPKMDFVDEICDTILSCVALLIKSKTSIQIVNERMEVQISKNYQWATRQRAIGVT